MHIILCKSGKTVESQPSEERFQSDYECCQFSHSMVTQKKKRRNIIVKIIFEICRCLEWSLDGIHCEWIY